MNNYTLQEKLGLARRLRLCGVPINIPDDDHPLPASQQNGLVIRQIQGSGRATQLNPFEIGYSVCIRIISNFRSEFWISGIGLRLPWQDKLVLLDDPGDFVPPRTFYSFFTSKTPTFSRQKVLNHHYRRYELSRARPLEGFLLWSGEVPIPERYAERDSLEAFVVIVDQYGGEYPAPVSLKVERRGGHIPLRRKMARRNITGKPAITTSLELVPERETSCEQVEELSDTNTPSLTQMT